jgi:putative PEP-CTERM system TPR-repeat lipoprotein
MPFTPTPRRLLTAAALTLALGAGGALADTATSQRYYDDAVKKLEAGDGSAAVIQLRNAIQQDAANRSARLLLGRLYLRTGDGVSAEKELRRALEMDAADEVQLPLAQALLMQGKFADVFKVVTPDAATADLVNRKLIIRGQAHLGLGQLDDAATMFEAAASSPPALPEAQIGLARVDMVRGKLEAADRRLAELVRTYPDHLEALLVRSDVAYALGRADDALAALNKAAAIAPNDPRVLLPRARLRIETGAIDEAEKDVAAILQRSPQDVMGRYMRASIQLLRGDAAGANQTFIPIETALRDFLPAQLLKGMIKLETGEYAQAEAALARFTAAVPRHGPARRLMGAANLRAGNPQGAVEVLEPLVAQRPDDNLARQLLAGAYLRLGRYDDAAEAWRRIAASGDDKAAAAARGALALLGMAGNGNAVESPGGLTPEIRRTALLVLEYVRNGEFDRARTTVEQLRAADPNDPVLINLEAGVYMAQGDLPTARSRLEEARRIDPTVAAVLDNLNAVDTRLGNLGAVEQRLRDVADDNPPDEGAVLRLAQFLVRNDRGEEAGATLESALDRLPQSLTLNRAAAELYQQQGDAEKLTRTADRFLAMGDSRPEALLLAGGLFRALNQPDRAVDALRRFVETRPDADEPRLLLAQSLIAAGRMDEARSQLDTIKARNPLNVPATLGLIDLALAKGETDKALGLADALRKDAPGSAAQLRANVLMRTKRPEDAIATLAQSVEQQPETGPALDLYDMRRRSGQEKAAVDGLKAYLDRKPDDARARLVLADALLAAKEYAEGAGHYEILLRRDSDNAALLNNLAWLKHETGSPEALQYARRAFAAAPGSAEIADTLGWILVEAGEMEEGLDLLRRAGAAAPANPDIQYHLAYALNATGKRDQAKVILERLVQNGRPFLQKDAAADLLASFNP